MPYRNITFHHLEIDINRYLIKSNRQIMSIIKLKTERRKDKDVLDLLIY